jgi:hypothetical protein
MVLMHARNRDEAGVVAVIVAISATMLFLVAALVVDLGLARDTRRQSQNTADASALAAANVLYPASTVCTLVNPNGTKNVPCYADAAKAAKDYAAANWGVTAGQWASCTDSNGYWYPVGYSACITFADSHFLKTQPANPTEVRVKAPIKNVKTGFGVLAGATNIAVGSAARAVVDAGTSSSCALCFLSSVNTNKFDVTINGAGIAINGNVTGNKGTWTAASISVLDPSQTDTKLGATPATTAGPAFTDPWASNTAVPPSTVGLTKRTTGNPCTLGPGIYTTPTIPNGACALKPGLYVVMGTWAGKNNTVVTGTGVTLYFTCGTTNPTVCSGAGQAGGVLNMKNGTLNYQAPTAGPLSGLAIVYDRGNTSAMSLQGNGSLTNFSGAIYAPKSTLDFNGTSNFFVKGGPIILKTATGNGTTGFTVTGASSVIYAQGPPSIALDQ